MNKLTVTIVTILLLVVTTLTATYVEGESENCVFSFTVPKVRMKNSCDSDERVQQKIASADSQLSRLRRELNSLKARFTYAMSRNYEQDVLEDVKQKINTLETITIPTLNEKIAAMEHTSQMMGSFQGQMPTEQEVMSLMKPIIQKQMAGIKRQVTEEILKSLEFQNLQQRISESSNSAEYSTVADSKRNSYPSPTTEPDYFGFLQERRHTTADPFESFNLEQFSSEQGKSGDFEQDLDSLSTLFRTHQEHSLPTDSGIPSLDNELPEPDVMTKFIQSDGRKNPESTSGKSESDKRFTELQPIFHQHAEKVKDILTQHMTMVNARLTRLLSVIQGLKKHYDSKFQEHDNNKVTDHEDMHRRIEEVKQEMLTSLENSKQTLFSDPQFQELMLEQHTNMENKILSQFSSATEPVKSDVEILKSQFQTVNRYQEVLQSTIQSFRRESRDIFQNIHGNITYLTDQVTELSKPKNESDYEIDYDLLRRDVEIEHAIIFVNKMKQDWPGVQENFTRIDSDILKVDQDIETLQSNVSKLQTNYSAIQTKITSTQAKIHSLRTSVTDLKNYNIRKSLEDLEWVHYDFTTNQARSACSGAKYIKKTRFSTGKYVGVTLCSSSRYKIYLSESIDEDFLEIGDTWKFGEDHCEFVGGTRRNKIRVGRSGHHFERIIGYKRRDWGQIPVIGTLSFFNPTPPWYECGVAIPG